MRFPAIEQMSGASCEGFLLHNSTYKVAKVLGISQPSVVGKPKYGIRKAVDGSSYLPPVL